MIFAFILAALCATNQHVAFGTPVYSSAVKVQSKSEAVPYFSPYSAQFVPLPNTLARYSAPVGTLVSGQGAPQLAPCVSPCVIESVPEYVAQVLPVSSPVNYANLPNLVPAYGPPLTKTAVVKEPKKKEDNGYEYSYLVYDENTGDQKAQREESDGAKVQGQYSLIQPDGYIREVQYTADDLTGFNAVVKNFLPKSPENKQNKKERLQEAKTPESADLKAEPESYGATKEVAKVPVGSRSKENLGGEHTVNNDPKKIVLTFEDIIRCANLIYGANSNNEQEKTHDVEKVEASVEKPKSALTYIILPSLGANKPC